MLKITAEIIEKKNIIEKKAKIRFSENISKSDKLQVILTKIFKKRRNT